MSFMGLSTAWAGFKAVEEGRANILPIYLD
jgi:hypothetical protein